MPLEQIAKRLGISMSIISQDSIHMPGGGGVTGYIISNRCVYRGNCSKRYLCSDSSVCGKNCPGCSLCNEICEDFTEEACFMLYESPYRCDGCDGRHHCLLLKRLYLHKEVHDAYRESLRDHS